MSTFPLVQSEPGTLIAKKLSFDSGLGHPNCHIFVYRYRKIIGFPIVLFLGKTESFWLEFSNK